MNKSWIIQEYNCTLRFCNVCKMNMPHAVIQGDGCKAFSCIACEERADNDAKAAANQK